jgi:hypothetical protein
MLRIRIRDPDLGSGMENIPDLGFGMNIPDHIVENFQPGIIFWLKNINS